MKPGKTGDPSPMPDATPANPPKVLSPEQIPGAIPAILGIGQAHFTSQCIYAVVKLGVPDIIGDGKMSVEQLGTQLPETLNKEYLQRSLRMLTQAGIFEESAGPDGEHLFSLTDAGALLQTKAPQPSVACGMLHWMEKPMWGAWAELSDVIAGTAKEAVPFSVANGAPIFDYYAKHPESAEPFNQFMSFFSAGELPVVLEHGGWDSLNNKTVVDVGGSLGAVMGAVAEKFPQVKCVSFDLPEVIDKVENPPPGVEFAKGNMFDSSTIPKGDVIFMKHILHDWSDDDSVKILKSCHAALPDDGKVFITEAILPPAGQITPENKMGLYLDMLMLIIGGKERSRKMWDDLVVQADFTVIEEKVTGHPSANFIVLGKKK